MDFFRGLMWRKGDNTLAPQKVLPSLETQLPIFLVATYLVSDPGAEREGGRMKCLHHALSIKYHRWFAIALLLFYSV